MPFCCLVGQAVEVVGFWGKFCVVNLTTLISLYGEAKNNLVMLDVDVVVQV